MKKIRSAICLVMLLCLTVSAALAFEYPEGTLHRGITGHTEEVEFLQYQLFYAGYLGDDISEVDGIFGKKTETAVMEFQRDHGLEVTGIVDPYTQMLLDELWENGMEPQGFVDPYPYCYLEYYDGGVTAIVPCPRHQQCCDDAEALLAAARNDEETIEALQSGIILWMEDMDKLYSDRMALLPEDAELLAAIQSSFLDYYRASLALWNRQYGSPSMAALERARMMLAEHCMQQCCMWGIEY